MFKGAFLEKLITYAINHMDFIVGLFVNVIIIILICIFIDVVNKRIYSKINKKVTDYPMLTMLPISLKVLKMVIACLLLAGFLQSFGYNVTSLVAGLGIVGLAVGFAAQTTIGNVFGSFSLLMDKVFKIGDYIQYDGDKAGYVENINLRSTTLRTAEGFLTNVPNNILANTAITNVSQTCKYKIDIKIAIECDTKPDLVKKAIEIMQNIAIEEELLENTALAFAESFEDTAINLRLIAYTTSTKWKDYMLLRSNILISILDKFQSAGIDLDIPDSRIAIDNRPSIFDSHKND